MRKTTLKNAKQLLMNMKRPILREISEDLKHGREGAKDDGMDTYDLASEERDREINFILNDREREKLQAIEEALERIEDGTLRHLRELRIGDRPGPSRGHAVQPSVRQLPGRAGEGSQAAAALRGRAGLPAAGLGRRRRREHLSPRLRTHLDGQRTRAAPGAISSTIFAAAVAAVDPIRAGASITCAEHPLPARAAVLIVIGAGKAAARMAAGVRGGRSALARLSGVVVDADGCECRCGSDRSASAAIRCPTSAVSASDGGS